MHYENCFETAGYSELIFFGINFDEHFTNTQIKACTGPEACEHQERQTAR